MNRSMSGTTCVAMPMNCAPVLAHSPSATFLAAPQPAMAVMQQRHGAPRGSLPPRPQTARALLSPHDLASMPVAFKGTAAGTRRRILCLGDSLTAGYSSNGHQFEPYGRAMVDALGAKGIAAEVLISGHSGRTAQEIVAAAEGTIVDVVGCKGKGLARILREDGPFDFAIIMAGTNDMGQGFSDQQILSDLRALHQLCRKHGVATVALTPPPLSAAEPNFARESQRLSLCKAITKLCSRMPGTVACIDSAELVPASNATFWESDKIHFSPAGSRCLGQRLAALVAERLSEGTDRHQAKKTRLNAKMVETPAPEHLVLPFFAAATTRSPRVVGDAFIQRGCSRSRSVVALIPSCSYRSLTPSCSYRQLAVR